jgi:hypothetical protein
MRCIGFSTGALAFGDWQRALELLSRSSATAVELSALRERELVPLVEALPQLDLNRFRYICFHAPSNLEELSEQELVSTLKPIVANGWPVVVHPGVIQDYSLWSDFGQLLCVENMDRRKPVGRTAEELSEILEKLNTASLCFDLGHSRHIDRTMSEAKATVRALNTKLKIIHLSEVDLHGRHVPLSLMALLSFSRLSSVIPKDCPIILESPVLEGDLDSEISRVERTLSGTSKVLPLAG